MKLISFFAFLLLFSTNGYSTSHERDAALKDIKDTLGIVPKFYEVYPLAGVAGAWNEMKTLQLNPKTALSGLDKELIGLAVAAQIPCSYCAYFHTQAAKLHGASDEQIKEAIAISAVGVYWGAYFEGMQIDKEEFREETDNIVKILKKRMKPDYKPPVLAPLNVVDADTAYQDIERNLGKVPYFVKPMPKNSVAGAWLTIKGVLFNPMTAVAAKTKHLIAMAVGSQLPGNHGVYWETQMSKLLGATDQEIAEAVEMAAITRHWSTWLNGNHFEEKAFKKEADKIFAFLKKQSKN